MRKLTACSTQSQILTSSRLDFSKTTSCVSFVIYLTEYLLFLLACPPFDHQAQSPNAATVRTFCVGRRSSLRAIGFVVWRWNLARSTGWISGTGNHDPENLGFALSSQLLFRPDEAGDLILPAKGLQQNS
jgi:hypothetical protein